MNSDSQWSKWLPEGGIYGSYIPLYPPVPSGREYVSTGARINGSKQSEFEGVARGQGLLCHHKPLATLKVKVVSRTYSYVAS